MPVAKTRMTEELLGDFANYLAPELVTPMVTYLASEACTTTHGAYSAAGGRYAKVMWALGQGWFAGQGVTPDRRGHPEPPRRDHRRGGLHRPAEHRGRDHGARRQVPGLVPARTTAGAGPPGGRRRRSAWSGCRSPAATCCRWGGVSVTADVGAGPSRPPCSRRPSSCSRPAAAAGRRRHRRCSPTPPPARSRRCARVGCSLAAVRPAPAAVAAGGRPLRRARTGRAGPASRRLHGWTEHPRSPDGRLLGHRRSTTPSGTRRPRACAPPPPPTP